MDDYLKIPLLLSLKSGHSAFFGFETQDITSIKQLAIYATFEHEWKICEHFIDILSLKPNGWDYTIFWKHNEWNL